MPSESLSSWPPFVCVCVILMSLLIGWWMGVCLVVIRYVWLCRRRECLSSLSLIITTHSLTLFMTTPPPPFSNNNTLTPPSSYTYNSYTHTYIHTPSRQGSVNSFVACVVTSRQGLYIDHGKCECMWFCGGRHACTPKRESLEKKRTCFLT